MIRKIIEIDTEKCNGCGICASACHEGAIGMRNGKAVLLRDDYCDGLGDCLPVCKAGAITFVEREADAYDEEAVQRKNLLQWPVQIKLVSPNASYFQGADLLIAADCTAFSFKDFHNHFQKGKVTLIGCSKLDGVDYSDKLTEILKHNEIRSVTVLKMEVPCCQGIAMMAKNAVQNSGKEIPITIETISLDGKIL